jgi:hypothetical protein
VALLGLSAALAAGIALLGASIVLALSDPLLARTARAPRPERRGSPPAAA